MRQELEEELKKLRDIYIIFFFTNPIQFIQIRKLEGQWDCVIVTSPQRPLSAVDSADLTGQMN